jgi:protein-tyrosine-phosphatase
MAQVIFDNLCKKNGRNDVIVKSAGIEADNEKPITQQAVTALKLCGEKMSSEKLLSTRFDTAMIGAFDQIITMTKTHAEQIGKYPNVKNLDELAGCGDIFDPYLYSINVYVDVCKKIQKALLILYNKIIIPK